MQKKYHEKVLNYVLLGVRLKVSNSKHGSIPVINNSRIIFRIIITNRNSRVILTEYSRNSALHVYSN